MLPMIHTLSIAKPRLPRTEAVADRVISVDETDSTNALAASMITDGSLTLPSHTPRGLAVAVVAADSQIAGRGRNGHAWISQPGSCSTISYVVRIPCAIALDETINGWLQMIAGLATLDALNGMIEDSGASMLDSDHFLELKWPNDVYCHGLKLGGLLSQVVMLPQSTEQSAEPSAATGQSADPVESEDDVALVIGVGLNLALPPTLLPTSQSTSLQLHANGLPPFTTMRDAIAAREVTGLRERLTAFIADPQGAVVALHEEMHAVCWARGRTVEAHFTDGTALTGTAVGLDNDASLILRTADGVEHTVHTADVGVL